MFSSNGSISFQLFTGTNNRDIIDIEESIDDPSANPSVKNFEGENGKRNNEQNGDQSKQMPGQLARKEAHHRRTALVPSKSSSSMTNVRNHFRRSETNNDVYFCTHSGCGKKVKSPNTTNLWSHLRVHHPPIYVRCRRQKPTSATRKQVVELGDSDKDESAEKSSEKEINLDGDNEDLSSAAPPKKSKQSKQISIKQSFGQAIRCPPARLATAVTNLMLSCDHASLKLLDSAQFQQILSFASQNFDVFRTSEQMLEHLRCQYNFKKEEVTRKMRQNGDTKITLDVKVQACHEKNMMFFSCLCLIENEVVQLVLHTSELKGDVDLGGLSQTISNLLHQEVLQGRVEVLLVGPFPGLKEAALLAASDEDNLAVVLCVKSALDEAWDNIREELCRVDLFKTKLLPLLNYMYKDEFMESLSLSEKSRLEAAIDGDTTTLMEMLLNHYIKLVEIVEKDDLLIDPLIRSEKAALREILVMLQNVEKLLKSDLLKVPQIHLSLWEILHSLVKDFSEDMKNKASYLEAVKMAEVISHELDNCFYCSDINLSADLKLLDYRVKNDRRDAISRSKAITRLDNLLKETTQFEASKEQGNAGQDQDTQGGLLESYWNKVAAHRLDTNRAVSQAEYGMSSTLKGYLDETALPIQYPNFHSAWIGKKGHPLFSIAKKHLASFCSNSSRIKIPCRDVEEEDLAKLYFIANYPDVMNK